MPTRMTMQPPSTLMVVDSMRNCKRISWRLAPIAFQKPIPLVRAREGEGHDVHAAVSADEQDNDGNFPQIVPEGQ